MTTLRVITVHPNYLPASDRADGYAVILGDCILPGHYLGRYPDAASADEACRYYANHYGLKALPLDDPSWHRPMLRLIAGGASQPSSTGEEKTR